MIFYIFIIIFLLVYFIKFKKDLYIITFQLYIWKIKKGFLVNQQVLANREAQGIFVNLQARVKREDEGILINLQASARA